MAAYPPVYRDASRSSPSPLHLHPTSKSRSVEFFTTTGTGPKTANNKTLLLSQKLNCSSNNSSSNSNSGCCPVIVPSAGIPRSETFSFGASRREDVVLRVSPSDNSFPSTSPSPRTTMINCPSSNSFGAATTPTQEFPGFPLHASFYYHQRNRLQQYCARLPNPAPPTSRKRNRGRPSKASTSRQQRPPQETRLFALNCVSWLKRIKVLKKFHSKMVQLGFRGNGIGNNTKLLFNNVHGDNVQLSGNGAIARRAVSFCKGVVFSDRPVRLNEKVCLKFLEVSTNWTGVLRIGFTNVDPASFKSNIPKYACPDLTSKSGFWAKAFSDANVKKDAVMYYYFNAAGDVHFGINGEEKGIFFTGVDVRKPLWALIDIYGNTTALELVDERAHLNNSGISAAVNISNFFADEISLPSLASLRVSSSDGATTTEIFPETRYFPTVIPGSLLFHRKKGRHAELGRLRCVAWRKANEYANGYVFTSCSMQVGEGIVIQVQSHDPEYASSLAFGVTSCDPDSIDTDCLPDDSHCLLDRCEYWVVKKDAAISPVTGDELCFTLSPDGEIVMSKNGGCPTSLMFVDNSIPLWAFFDIYGTTTKIFLVGKTAAVTNSAQNFRIPMSASSSNISAAQVFHGVRRSASDMNSFAMLPRSQSSILPGLSESSNLSSFAVPSIEDTYTVTGSKPKDQDSNADMECVACCERAVDSVFYTCGHMCMCYECAKEYTKTLSKRWCPICRAPITDIIRTYKS